MPSTSHFACQLVRWQAEHGRHHLPWQKNRNPYHVWLSEVMLQQTQVSTVIAYYERFLERFPTLESLAAASQDEVMPYWAGLGYYARARNLHRCAQVIVQDYDGVFPACSTTLATLPGIGRSTAAAIAAFCFDERSPIMDGNVKRVFTRHFGVYGHPQQRAIELSLWGIAEKVVAQAPDTLSMPAYTQSLMDLGSMVCTRSKPSCNDCPVQTSCYAHAHNVTAELPTRKARKAQPERSCQLVLLQHDGHVLLEQRPDNGIWGGLWVPLQFDELAQLHDYSVQHGFQLAPQQRLASFLHVFSHFKLDITPWLIPITQPPTLNSNQQWVAIADLHETALPAPVKKIVDGVYPLHAAQQMIFEHEV